MSLYPYPYPHVVDDQDDDAWDKFGRAIGNLKALRSLHIRTPNYHDDDDSTRESDDDDDEVVPIPDWGILASILSHLRQRITLTVALDEGHLSTWRVENSQSLARAIHGHPTITCFHAGIDFPYEASDALYSALATLPALASVILYNTEQLLEDESITPRHESRRFGHARRERVIETLSIESWKRSNFEAEDYIALIPALQANTTLKVLQFSDYINFQLTEDKDKQMAALLKKNYGLESFPAIDLDFSAGDARTILRLNAAGRRYLVQDGSSVSKGVEVLSAVRSDIDCVFLHLLENPRLCNRSAVEMASDSSEERIVSVNPANQNGKREQGQALEEGKESRRRRA